MWDDQSCIADCSFLFDAGAYLLHEVLYLLICEDCTSFLHGTSEKVCSCFHISILSSLASAVLTCSLIIACLRLRRCTFLLLDLVFQLFDFILQLFLFGFMSILFLCQVFHSVLYDLTVCFRCAFIHFCDGRFQLLFPCLETFILTSQFFQQLFLRCCLISHQQYF